MMKRLTNALMLAAALAAAACSASDSTLPTVTSTGAQQLNVSAALSATTSGDPWSYPSLSSTFVGLPSLTGAIPSSCAYSTTNLRFDCAAVTVGGLTFKTSYYLLGTDGGSLATPDSTKIAAVRVLMDVTGSFGVPTTVGAATTIAISKHDDLTLSGLLASSRVVNGSSTERDVLTTTASGVSTTSTLDINSATVNLALPTGTNKYPASGTLTSDISTLTSVPPLPAITTTTHSVLTFNGTNFATLVTTTGSHTQTCRIDLSFATSPSCS